MTGHVHSILILEWHVICVLWDSLKKWRISIHAVPHLDAFLTRSDSKTTNYILRVNDHPTMLLSNYVLEYSVDSFINNLLLLFLWDMKLNYSWVKSTKSSSVPCAWVSSNILFKFLVVMFSAEDASRNGRMLWIPSTLKSGFSWQCLSIQRMKDALDLLSSFQPIWWL